MIVVIFFLGLLLFGTPIGFAIGVAQNLGVGPSRMFKSLDNFPFLAMPFFILAGEIMNGTGITARLMRFANVLVGHFRGGRAQANMVASVMFTGLTGAATADAAAFGRTLVPEMTRQGYPRDFACAVTAAGSIIGPTIPPSGIMVIYGSLMGVSIGGLFAAGILPGLVICLACMLFVALSAARNGLPPAHARASFKTMAKPFAAALTALLMPVIILGGILGGFVTPTEAASIAVAYALFLGFVIYRNLTLPQLAQMLLRTALISGVIFVIIGFAGLLGLWMSFNRVPQAIAETLLGISENPAVITLLIIALLLVVGTVMDITALLILLAPVLAPVSAQIGVEPSIRGSSSSSRSTSR